MLLSSTSAIEAVAIGASFGGIEALTELLPSLAANTRIAIFIVQHLPRHQPSLLTEIFSNRCALPIYEGGDHEFVKPGTIYFAPPDYHMLLDTGPTLTLSVDDLVNYSRPSIDVLFESAADTYGKSLLGILLTGGNRDGAAGLEYIRRCGGVTAVQQPESALADIMPMSALARDPAHNVLTLPQIAQLLAELSANNVISPKGSL